MASYFSERILFKSVFNLFKLLTLKQQKRFYALQFFVVLAAIFEIVGIASIAPFMALISDTSVVETSSFFAKLYEISGRSEINDFVVLLGFLVLFSLALSSVVSMFTVACLSSFAAQTGSEISQRLFEYYFNQNWLYFTKNSSPQLVNKISHESQRMTSQVLLPLVQMNAKLVSALGIVIALSLYKPIVAFVGIVTFFVIYLLLFKFVRGALQKNGVSISKMLAVRFRIMNDVFGGVKDLILSGRKEYYMDEFGISGDRLASSMSLNIILGQLPRYAIEFVAFGVIVSLVIYLFLSHDQNLAKFIPELSVYALAGLKLLPAVQHIYSAATQIKGNIHSFESIQSDLVASMNQASQKSVSAQQFGKEIENTKVIKLVGLKFSYPDREENVLNGVNLSIPMNSTIGLVGPSGAGKSTLVDILMGLVKPSSGKIVSDGHVIEFNQMRAWQDLIGYVPQTIFLSEGSISENIAFGINPVEIDFEKIDETLKAAHLYDYVNSLPEGRNTCVGERGVQLSGGQRQRLGIARALYLDPSVLIFDEATSALDGITEKVIMDAINSFQGKKTIVIIAHRLKTVMTCDKIYYLDKGVVMAQGTYSELLSNNTKFREMAVHS
jgi:ATP-binding cassette, subfamily B, bacterial PglK